MLFSLEGSAFAGDEDGSWRDDAELFRVIAFIVSDADAAAGIDVEKRIANGYVHERLRVRERDGLLVNLDTDLVAKVVAELFELIARNVGDERAVGIVEADDVAFDAFIGGDGNFRSQADELRNLGADEIEIPAIGQVSGGGRENIATVKGGRDGRFDHPGLIGDFAGQREAVAVEHQRDQAIIGKNKKLALFGRSEERRVG